MTFNNENYDDDNEPPEREHKPDCQCVECWQNRDHNKGCYGSHCYMCGGCMVGGDDEDPPECSVCA